MQLFDAGQAGARRAELACLYVDTNTQQLAKLATAAGTSWRRYPARGPRATGHGPRAATSWPLAADQAPRAADQAARATIRAAWRVSEC